MANMSYHYLKMIQHKFKKLFRIHIILTFCFLVFFVMNMNEKVVNFGKNENDKFIAGTFFEAGGFGNQIWRFASLYGIGKTLHRLPYIEAKVFEPEFTNIKWKRMNLSETEFVFPLMFDTLKILQPPLHLTKNATFAEDCCKYDEPKKLLNISEQYLKISGDYLQSFKFFHSYKNDVRNLLECGPKIMENVNKIAEKMFDSDLNFKLCVHIRRGDFIEDIMLESKEEFVIPAIKYVHQDLIQKGYKNISLVFIGNDIKFSNNIKHKYTKIKNVYISQNNSRGEDLCFGINFCDSVILTASGSTFGWWMAYLMKSEGPVFYNSQVSDFGNHTKDIFKSDIFLPEWIELTLNDGNVVKDKKRYKNRQ